MDEPRLSAGLQLLPEVADVHLADVLVALEVVSPDTSREVGLGNDLPGLAHEVEQEPVFGRRQGETAHPAPRVVAPGVELEIRDPKDLRRRLAPAKHRAQMRGQDLEAERLDEVVIGPGVQPDDLIARRILGGQHQDPEIGLLATDLPTDGEAVRSGHEHVEHDRVGSPFADGAQREDAVRRRPHLVALACQRPCEDARHAVIVVRDEHPWRPVVTRHGKECQEKPDIWNLPVGPRRRCRMGLSLSFLLGDGSPWT